MKSGVKAAVRCGYPDCAAVRGKDSVQWVTRCSCGTQTPFCPRHVHPHFDGHVEREVFCHLAKQP